MPFTIAELKKLGHAASFEYEIDYDKLEDPKNLEAFNIEVRSAMRLVPSLESIHAKLTSGKSVTAPGQPSALTYEEMEHYIITIEDELVMAYCLNDIYERVNAIKDVLK